MNANAIVMAGLSDANVADMARAGNVWAIEEAKRRRLKAGRTSRPQPMVSSDAVCRMIERQEIAPIIKQRLIAEIIQLEGGK